MVHVLVSACLLGELCKWDGSHNRNGQVLELLEEMKEKAEFYAICPEQMGGLPTPRPAAEIRISDGAVVNTEGKDVTGEFERGAELALEIAKAHGCTLAVLKERSPSCGSREIYDGTFSHKRVPGMGKTAKLLTEHGVKVFGETELEAAKNFMEAQLSR